MELLPSDVTIQQQTDDDLREAVSNCGPTANTQGRISLLILKGCPLASIPKAKDFTLKSHSTSALRQLKLLWFEHTPCLNV